MRKNALLFTGLLLLLLAAWYWYQSPRVVNGEPSRDFSITRADGKLLSRDSFAGQYLLLHFWGSWCGPCRQENPRIAELYHKYQGKTFADASGFEILSIGVETRIENWRQAIAMDGLDWPNHWTDLKRFDNSLAELYGVREIPTTFLIDPKGMIVGARQSPEEIDRFLQTRLK